MKFSIKWVILGVVVLFLLWIGGSYNGLITAKTRVDQTWAQVENNYQSRFDMIPNLQAIVAGAASNEKSILLEVTEARTRWLNSENRTAQVQSASQFDSAFSRLLVSVESYPQITSTQNFITFQSQLEGVENRVRQARKDYNDQAGVYNIKVQTFPANLIAKLFGFEKEPFFESVATAETAPKVDFTK